MPSPTVWSTVAMSRRTESELARSELRDFVAAGLALGCARLTMPPWAPSRAVAVATIHAALDRGVRLLDTANCYGAAGDEPGGNEALVREALASWSGDPDEVLVATKGGATRPSAGWGRDGRPESIRRACDASLQSLGVQRIGLYQLHQVDPEVPFEESVGAMVELVAAGKVAMFGVSNVSVTQLATAASAGAVSVQDQMSLANPFAGPIILEAAARGLQVLGWAPLAGVRTDLEAMDHPVVVHAAETVGATARQVAIAWLRSLGDHVTPIVGPTSPAEVDEVATTPHIPSAVLGAVTDSARDRDPDRST